MPLRKGSLSVQSGALGFRHCRSTRMSRNRTEADEFFRETYRLPVAGLALVLLGDVAIVVAAIAALG